MLLLKTSGAGNGGEVVGSMSLDDDDDDDLNSSSANTSTASRGGGGGIRNLFRKRHKSVTIGFVRAQKRFRA